MLRRASASLNWSTKRGTSLLSDLEDEDLQVIHEGELFRSGWGRWQSGWWRLCWTDGSLSEAVLVHFAEPLARTRERGKQDCVFMRRIKTVVPVEKHEVSAGSSTKADGMFRFALGTVSGNSFMLAAGSHFARDEWLQVIYEVLIKQALRGYHEDPKVVTDLQAFQEALRREREQRQKAGYDGEAEAQGPGGLQPPPGGVGASASAAAPTDLIDFGDHDLLDLGALSPPSR
mmetsp:Transcript_12930/g.37623  ORF Transcript_12930/g.37623 Transcript_12930/m.37623 type:complete len:231 (-) Transcript_12930:232-924(-)|eukprot:CAMPEP_0118962260 /NCGR_PEP_ID=MMETSP1173-20130426/665_1 /TAXON_ID=1034831 /ORGANISM="Rhizochromulina marina cf, Strain CCMP1243" /LENGTH=230 /DNA_ID=CAMNT_0006910507 /DNA_START=97 /DNA_END=789 /DNA_ORIENTATION=-